MSLFALDDLAPRVPPSAWVAPSATLIGDVRLGEHASIWFGATIRADNTPITIGAGSNIQDGSVCHSDPDAPLTIGSGVTVGHRVILHGCTIGDHVLVGMGATVLNGATVPEDCLIGANALITEGRTFERGSLIVGAPAKAVRMLDDAALALIRHSASVYVEAGDRYRKGLRRL